MTAIGLYIVKLIIAIAGVISIIGVIKVITSKDSYIVGYDDMECNLISTRYKRHDLIEFNPYKEDFDIWCVSDDLKKTKDSRAP